MIIIIITTTDYLISTTPDDRHKKKKKKKIRKERKKEENLLNSRLCLPNGAQSENKKSEKSGKYLDFARELWKKQTLWHESDGESNCG